MSLSRLRTLVASGLALVPVLLLAAGAGSASSTAATAAATLQSRVYAPYFETWSGDHIFRVASRSGAHHLTLAFIETPHAGIVQPGLERRQAPADDGRGLPERHPRPAPRGRKRDPVVRRVSAPTTR